MTYNILNKYVYDGKSFLLNACDFISQPLRVALGGKTIHCSSGREEQDNRILSIALCCLIVPVIAGAICLLVKHISKEARIIDSLAGRVDNACQNHAAHRTQPAQQHSSALKLLLSDKPFEDIYIPRVPLLTSGLENHAHTAELGNSFIDHIFEEFRGEKSTGAVDVIMGNGGELYIQKGAVHVPLKEVMESINWKNLGDRWTNIDKENIPGYLKRSVLFERLQDHKAYAESPFQHPSPFIRLYTSHDFYFINQLIRKGTLPERRHFYSSEETNYKLSQKDPQTINKVVKELMLVTLMMAKSLHDLPNKYTAKVNVIRVAHVPASMLDKMAEGQVFAERAFLSASAPGGGFAGGGPCGDTSFKVKYVITPRHGKHVDDFSAVPENEVLFGPFTQFKVIKRSGNEQTGFRIEMVEL